MESCTKPFIPPATPPLPPERPPELPPCRYPYQPLLSVHRHLCTNSDIVWDIIHPPVCARLRHPQFPSFFLAPDLSAPAFDPPASRVWISCEHPALAYWFARWGPIKLTADNISILALLTAIYDYLRTPLTPDDITQLQSVPTNRASLSLSREQRAKDSYEIEAVVLSHPYRRVDLAGGHRRFQGIRIVVDHHRTWSIYFNLLPGPVPRLS